MKIEESIVLRTLEIVAEAAAVIRKESETFSQDKIEYKDRNDLVSYVDRETEMFLRRALREILPESGFIGEEGDDEKFDAEWRWIVDPLDGTTNFIQGIPAYCISVALQKDEKTVLGIVHDVPKNEIFHAIFGKGAWLNGKVIKVSQKPDLASALIGTGFPRSNGDMQHDYLAAIGAILDESQGIRRIGAAALDLAYVACGRLDGFFELGLKAWDVAAGVLILEEAGGKASDLQNGRNFLFGRQIAASNSHLHDSFLQILSQHLGRWTVIE